MPAEVAVTVTVPAVWPMTMPVLLSMVAEPVSPVSPVDQVTVLVISCVEPSVYVSVAVNGCVVPATILKSLGVIAIETDSGAVTVSVWVELVTPDRLAVIVVVPTATEAARPVFVPRVAMLVEEEFQVTALVMSCVESSVYMPIAVNCWVSPLAMLELVGITTIDTNPGTAVNV